MAIEEDVMSRFAQQVEELVGEGAGDPVRARRGADLSAYVLAMGLVIAVGIGVSAGVDGLGGLALSGAVLAVVVAIAVGMLRADVALVPHGDDVAVVGLSAFGRPQQLEGFLPGPVRADQSKQSVYHRVDLGDEVFWVSSRREVDRIALAS